jgi:hypothetical protein
MVWFDADAHSGNTVQNNIFSQSGGGVMHGGSAAGTLFRSNNWYGGNANAAAGTGDVIGNPLLVNAGGLTANDYRLQALSPAIHTALDASDVSRDFWGSARTPTFDIGAHEQSLALGTSAPVRPPLEAPFGFNAVAASTTSAQLTWSAAAGAVSYRVYRDRALVATVETVSYLDATLTAGRTYSYAVSSIDAIGEESAPTENVAITTAALRENQAPTAPSRLAANVNGATVALSWGASTDNAAVAGYVIYRNNAIAATIAATEWKDNGLAAGTYVYDVVAFDAAGNYSSKVQTTVTVTAAAGRSRSVRR